MASIPGVFAPGKPSVFADPANNVSTVWRMRQVDGLAYNMRRFDRLQIYVQLRAYVFRRESYAKVQRIHHHQR